MVTWRPFRLSGTRLPALLSKWNSKCFVTSAFQDDREVQAKCDDMESISTSGESIGQLQHWKKNVRTRESHCIGIHHDGRCDVSYVHSIWKTLHPINFVVCVYVSSAKFWILNFWCIEQLVTFFLFSFFFLFYNRLWIILRAILLSVYFSQSQILEDSGTLFSQFHAKNRHYFSFTSFI